MKKYLLTIVMALLVGFLLSNYMLKQYDKPISFPVFGETKAYLIQQGVYSSYESMIKNTSNLSDYIYSTVDNMYYVYVAMTLDSDNISKLQKYYRDKNIVTIVKTTSLNDSNLINSLYEYDSFLKQTNDVTTIKEIISQTLSKYKGA